MFDACLLRLSASNVLPSMKGGRRMFSSPKVTLGINECAVFRCLENIEDLRDDLCLPLPVKTMMIL